MTDKYWQKLEQYFHKAINLSTEERKVFLLEIKKKDESLHDELVEILAIEGNDETQYSDIIRQAKSAISHNQDPLIGLKLGAFTILEKIADGGMAAVYKGKREQNDFEQWAAIKVLHSSYQSTTMLESFHFERRTLASFEHAHIAKVFDGGTALNDLPFLTMELIDGLPIDQYCETKQLSVEQIFELFLQLCEALDYAHRRLIVHRDIKPSNVLITAEGQVKLIDFGIAKEIELGGESADLTAAGQRALTPTYASPEQVSGKPITIATDIYSLGILLYKVLTTNLPYKSDNSLQLIEAICKDYPTSPSDQITMLLSDDEYKATQSQPVLRYLHTTKKKIKGDVDNIVLKAINKDPNDRYASINEFSSDIRRFLAGEAVIARGNSFSYKLSKWIKRNKMITLLTCSLFFSFFFFGSYSIYQARQLTIESETAKAVTNYLVNMFLVVDMDEPQTEIKPNRQMTVLELLDLGKSKIEKDLKNRPVVKVRLLNSMADAYQGMGDYKSAAELIDSAIALQDEQHIPNSNLLKP